MMVALTHPMHGTHIAYSSAEINACKEAGWTEDTEVTKELMEANIVKRGPGRPKKDD